MTWAAPVRGTGDSWQWLLDSWVGLGFDLWSKPIFPRWSYCNLVSPEVSPGCFIQMSRFARLLILRISLLFSSLAGS